MYILTKKFVLLFAYNKSIEYSDKSMHTFFIPKYEIWKSARESNAIQPYDVIVKSLFWLNI